ncbi:ABC transporter substrate-binding protein [Vallicoccus soli]|uniref:ABC transporter substrate-binding protein n=1 Tax=Vallicoccus soli TaxID=2339232 RepID=A0A3A3Z3X3_9ACTN|nr:ABC transporter substrate-binding protein [Vallicoccus soli]RJK97608.1 ABC transporter substrate-binding protein [Vallicoccus soli]
MTARRRTALALAGAAVLALPACGADAGAGDQGGAAAAGGAYPLTLENCGAEVTLDAPPERVVLLKSAPVTYLHELGVLDRVVARAGAYPRGYYDDATWAELQEVPLLTDELDASGHLQLSPESVLDLEPDLVLGQTDNLDRATLEAVGVPLLEEPALCPDPPEEPSFAAVEEQLRAYGRVFDREQRAEERVAALRAELEQTTASVVDAPEGEARTAAVLYPTVGGGTLYAYGTRSMAHPQLEAAGFEDAFADVDQRVFEVTLEEVIGRDPDVLVLLHSEGEPGPVREALASLPGADRLTAVREDRLFTQLFNFTEPPSPLALEGLQRLVAWDRGAR